MRIVVWLLFPLGQVLTCHLCPGIHGIYSCTSAGTSGCVRLIKNELKPVHVREIRVFSCDVRIVGWDVRPIRMPRIRDRNGKTCPREYFFLNISFSLRCCMLLLMNDKSWKAPWERDLSRDEFRPIEMNEILLWNVGAIS